MLQSPLALKTGPRNPQPCCLLTGMAGQKGGEESGLLSRGKQGGGSLALPPASGTLAPTLSLTSQPSREVERTLAPALVRGRIKPSGRSGRDGSSSETPATPQARSRTQCLDSRQTVLLLSLPSLSRCKKL